MELSKADKKDIEENKELAAVSYAWAMSVIVFLARRESKFVCFHAKQAIFLFGLSIIFWFIPYIGKFLELFVAIFMLIGFINAIKGDYFRLPLLESCKEQMICAINLIRRILRRSVRQKEDFPEIKKMVDEESRRSRKVGK